MMRAFTASVLAPRSVDIQTPLKTIFADGHFRFCHDPAFEPSLSDASWCSLIDEASVKVCPDINAVCRGLNREEANNSLWDFMSGLPDLARFGLWALAAAAVGLLIYAVARNVDRFKGTATMPQALDDDTAQAHAKADKAIERDVRRLITLAEQALNEGDLILSLSLAQAALLRRLETHGVLRVHPSRTSAEYLKDLQDSSDSSAVSDILNAIERAQFGTHKPDKAFAQSILTTVGGLLERMRPASLVLFILALATISTSCRWPFGKGDEFSLQGAAAVLRFLAATGVPAKERRASLAKLNDETVQLVLLPEAHLSDADWEHIGAWVDDGGRLIVAGGGAPLPKWLSVQFKNSGTAPSKAGHLRLGATFVEAFGTLHPVTPSTATFETSTGSVPILLSGDKLFGAELEYPDVERTVIVFADATLFTNAALLLPDNARFLQAFFSAGQGPAEFVGDLTGDGRDNPLHTAGRGKMAPFLVQAALFMLVLYAWRGTMFGRPRTALERRRRHFREHVMALGLQFARARAAQHAMNLLGAYLIDRLRQRTRLGGTKGVGALAEALSRRSGRPMGDIARDLMNARQEPSVELRKTKPSPEDLREQAEAISALFAMMPRRTHTQRRSK